VKFSVLLPTRNRLEYLRYAVETVRRQDYDDWEIVISDNHSEDDIEGYARSLNDPRVRYYRTDSFVPVTENWNNALEHSTGDYVVMLGDDDCLMQNYFSTIGRLVEEFDRPDFVYTSAFLYSYPGVNPDAPQGFLMPYGHAPFLGAAGGEPYLMDKRLARELVEGFMDFRLLYGFNMQFFVISRRLVEALADKGPFFQSPFPDYYASNAMFLKAGRVLVCPYPLVTIGVTPKSYGFYHTNRREAEGVEFLKSLPDPQAARRLERVLLPGTNINTSWLFSAETLKQNFGDEFGLRPSYRRYRFLQITHVYEQVYLHKTMTGDDLGRLKRRMRPWERAVYGAAVRSVLAFKRLLSPENRSRFYKLLRARQGQFPAWGAEMEKARYRNILEVYEQVSPFQT
jgi:glycosyltransferase involved in cell wall biosynthesis